MRTEEKSLLESSPNSAAIEFHYPREHHYRLIHRIDDGTRYARIDDFRNGTPAEGKDGRATRHRLDHHQAERLRPIDREKAPAPRQEIRFCCAHRSRR